MRVRHKEYSIYVRAPYDRGLCLYGPHISCKNDGDFALKIMDDRDHVILQYANICNSHLLMAVIDQLGEH